jgi:hypothetical protein
LLTIGISISRHRIDALALDGTGSSLRVAAVAERACSEPFGEPGDASAVAEQLRAALPGRAIPGAVVTLPPPLTYLRPMTLPVADIGRARAIHLAELEGNLPIEDGEILSDLLPGAPGEAGSFLAIASRRSFVERTAGAFRDAGLPVERVVTDHVALLHLAAHASAPADALLLGAFHDLLMLRVSGGGVLAARQFPASLAEAPEEILSAAREAMGSAEGGPAPAWLFGKPGAVLSEGIPGATIVPLPEGVDLPFLPAFGAALVPRQPGVSGGFSLRTSAEAEAEKAREGRRTVVAAVAGGAAILLAVGALQFAVWAEGQKAARARALVRKEFSEAAPDVRNVVQAAAQIREKVASVRRQQKELGTDSPAPPDFLLRASQALPKGEIAVREASVDGSRLRLGGEAGEARLVESYREALAGAFGPSYSITVQESTGSAKGTSVRFTILVERKGETVAS